MRASAQPTTASDDGPSRAEVQQRISSLYDQAETATGNYNATRAMSKGGRPRTGAARGSASGRLDPSLDRVARQWFDAARTQLGPSIPAILPPDRMPKAAESRPARPGRLPGDGSDMRGPEGAGPSLLELTAGPASAAPARAVPELTVGATAPAGPVPELTAGSATAVAAGPAAEAPTGPVAALPAMAGTLPEAAGAAAALPASAARPWQPALRSSKEQLLTKLTRARELLAQHTAQQSPAPRAAMPQSRPAPAEESWLASVKQQPWTSPEASWLAPQQGREPWPPQPNTPDTSGLLDATGLLDTTGLVDANGLGETAGVPEPSGFRGTAPYPGAPTPLDAGPALAPSTGTFTTLGTPAPSTGTFTTPGTPAPSTGTFTTPGTPAPSTGTFTTPGTPAPVTLIPGPATDTGIPAIPRAPAMPQATAVPAMAPAPVVATADPSPAGPAVAQAPAVSTGIGETAASAYERKAAKALAFARAQIGRPCVWGATGPDSYDCSSLTQAAWRVAGVALPRAAYEQAGSGSAIQLAELQRGDLIFFYADVSHVGLYAGNGVMVHAPSPGASIREESIFFAGPQAIHSAIRPA
jgi:cell wall-associated NlpC family hydrolase